jgi:hypothetical protein
MGRVCFHIFQREDAKYILKPWIKLQQAFLISNRNITHEVQYVP